MKALHPALRRPLPLSGVLVALLLAAVAVGQTPPADAGRAAADETRAAIATRQQTQRQLDDWATEKADLENRYHAAREQVAWLERRRDEQTARLQALQGRVGEMQRRLAEADRLEGSMQDTLQVIFRRLEAEVAAGLPFLPAERQRRLDNLRAELVRPDASAAEKLRRLLEALQVEAGYAGTVEVYQDEIDVDGQPVHVDILRLGRVSLFWRAPDGGQVGLYDGAAARWRTLSGGDARRINLAMEMAARTRPVAVISLPLGRIAPPTGGAP